MKKKMLKTTMAVFAVLMAVSSVGASAANSYVLKRDDTYDLDMHHQYTLYPERFMKVFYDYGTTNPYDDARATTEMNIEPGQSVTAKVYISDNNGHDMQMSYNDKDYSGIVYSGEAYLSGIDYAKYVKHEGYKKKIGTTTADGYVVRYKQVN